MNLDLRNANIENIKLWIEREEIIIHDTNSAREHKRLWGFPVVMSNGSALRVGWLNPGCCGFWLNNPAHVVAMAPCSDKVTLSCIDSRSPEHKTVARRLRRSPNLLHPTSPCYYPIMMSPITWEVSGQIHKKDSRASGGNLPLPCQPCPLASVLPMETR